MINNEPWFVLNDVCGALGISNPSQVKVRLDDDIIANEVIPDSLGRMQNMTVINEDGFKKEEVQAFRRWVTNEVSPSDSVNICDFMHSINLQL